MGAVEGEGTHLAHTELYISVSRVSGLLTMALQTCRETWLVSHIHRPVECGFSPAGENQLEMPSKKLCLAMRYGFWNVSREEGPTKKQDTHSHADSAQTF